MILYNISELWHANRLEIVEAGIGFASERDIPVWLIEKSGNGEVSSRSTQASAKAPDQKIPANFRSAMNQRLRMAKSKSFLEYLSPQTRSRLGEICLLKRDSVKPAEIPDQV